MNVRWVKQEHARGCGVACLAMLTGKTYADVHAEFPTVSDESGGNCHWWEDWLSANGFALAYKKRYQHWPEYGERTPWPPEPFSIVHLCEVTVSGAGGHMVVMLADGSVLDPLTPESKRLTDYHEVYNIAAVVPIW